MLTLQKIKLQILEAAQDSGWSPDDIRLIAVVKGQPIEKIREAVEAGQVDLGENYAQEFLSHNTAFEKDRDIHWHFIGHLQRNKVKHIIDKVSLIHTVDSLSLAQEINRRAESAGKTQAILIEVNLGEETSKSGLPPQELENLIRGIHSLDQLDLKGLMTIPPFFENPEDVRPYFRRLKEIRDEMNSKAVYKYPLTELSMGMSHDFEIAIEEGATIVRIGTGIFGPRTG